ncbi:MAG TPA: cytochrome c oxidase subunit 4 [Acidimicrobiales bacterium]|jgi:hypothetical protein|nr:cytochrome c oxidase subunit 4 [Acidimicrobiales bacterium]
MKVESRTILGAFFFLVILAVVYWVLIALHGHTAERSGVAMLIFSFSAYGMLGFYLLAQYLRRNGIPRVEDRFDATQEEGAGVIDYFPAASIWPAGMGLSMIMAAAGLVWGLWYLYIALVLFFGSVAGWVTESDYTEDVLPGIDPHELDNHHEVPSMVTLPHHGGDHH